MKEINVRDARENFASLLRQIEQGGEEITIFRHGKPVARMTRVEAQDAVPFISRISLREGIPPMQETAADTVRALREEDERG